MLTLLVWLTKTCHAYSRFFSGTDERSFIVRKLNIWILLFCAAAASADESPLSYEADIELGYGYDSNVSVDDVDLTTNVGDQFADLRLSGKISYETENDAEFSAGLTLSEKLYDTFDRFDGSLALATLSANKELGDVELGIAARYVDYDLDDRDFLSLSQVSPSLSWFPSKETYVRLTYEYSDESYERNNGRDNERHELGGAFYYFINGLRHYISFQAQLSEEDADSELFNNDAWQFRANYHRTFKLFSADAELKLSYRFQNRQYDDLSDPDIGDFREDDRNRYELELEIPFATKWAIVSEIIYNDYESNLESADYTQEVYQVTLKYEF